MDPVQYLDPTTLFICVLVGVGTWFVFLRYRSHDSSSRNKEYTESLTMELSEKEEEIKRLEESVKRLDVVNQSLTMELSEKEEEITRLKQELDKEIKAHKREKAQLLEKIRRREEEIRKDRENESRLKNTIKVPTAECTELRNSNHDVRVTLAEKKNKLGEARQQLKALHATIESKEKAVEELGEKLREQRRIISDLDSKRQEETIQQLQDENSRLRDEMSKITKPKQSFFTSQRQSLVQSTNERVVLCRTISRGICLEFFVQDKCSSRSVRQRKMVSMDTAVSCSRWYGKEYQRCLSLRYWRHQYTTVKRWMESKLCWHLQKSST
ncbi:centrosome-associated protein CEP250-like isoform X2 [Mya arenaria]|uniref:centrosome-associated protein CEP250-like isoform X2 n=1 Tax=Mya arenaria TaxID=6604 RepID=UPI0022E45D49|nr:centrosome-associated protein CEP250-like isoform X2 [Mya arenaria]